jgi:uncharacterized membrane protein
MHWWFAAFGVTAVRRPTDRRIVSDVLVERATMGLPTGSVLQTSGNLSAMLLAGALVLVLGLAAVAVWQGQASRLLEKVRRRLRTGEARSVDPSGDVATTETAEPGSTTGSSQEADEPSDQQVILEMLEANDGRTKQARIVDATGWSKSKVSMLLSEMEDEGDITKLRVGRENIISVEGNEPEAADSPFESR